MAFATCDPIELHVLLAFRLGDNVAVGERRWRQATDMSPQSLAGCLRRNDVDKHVPKALQRKDQRGGVVETKVHVSRMSNGVDTIDACRYLPSC